jgi:hypothetical protein
MEEKVMLTTGLLQTSKRAQMENAESSFGKMGAVYIYTVTRVVHPLDAVKPCVGYVKVTLILIYIVYNLFWFLRELYSDLLGPWDSSHGDHFRCNKFEAEKQGGKLSGAVKSAFNAEENQKRRGEEKKRYDWHADRVNFFSTGCRFAKERALPLCDPPCESRQTQDRGGTRRCVHGLLGAKKQAIADYLTPFIETPPSAFQEQALSALDAGNDAYIRYEMCTTS